MEDEMPGKTNGKDGIQVRLAQIESGSIVTPLNFRPSKAFLKIMRSYMDRNNEDSITKAIENMVVDSFMKEMDKDL